MAKLTAEQKAEAQQSTGDVLLEFEIVLNKLYDRGLQLGDVLGIAFTQTWAHRMDAVETYTSDDSHPILKYGHKDEV
jgi:hypothetical protein